MHYFVSVPVQQNVLRNMAKKLYIAGIQDF